MTDRAEELRGVGGEVRPKAERQVGERLSEQAMEIAESWVNYPTPPPDTLAHREFTLACAYLSQARQLAEAERENGRLREAIERVLVGVGIASWLDMEMVLRAALNPPDPPASPAEGGDTKGPGIT